MLVFREADARDISALCALEEECFSSPWSERAFCESFGSPSASFFVCEADGEIVGYVGCVRVLDECSITNVAVTSRHRRRGIAHALLDMLERAVYALGVRYVYLEVRVSNAAAISVYERRGYTLEGVRRHFYTMPVEDAYVYKKQLHD